MTSYIAIELDYGNASVQEEDIDRARNAAEQCLIDAGVSIEAAFSAYTTQWAELDDEKNMTGDALAWIAAEQAANRALTQGWHQPAGAGCSIRAWTI